MNKKIKKITLGVMIMIFPFSLLFGCGGPEKRKAEQVPVIPVPLEEYVEGAELLCVTDSLEQAQNIADMYGIELVEFSYGVATFHTTEDPRDVIARGKEKGYPELSINGYSELY